LAVPNQPFSKFRTNCAALCACAPLCGHDFVGYGHGRSETSREFLSAAAYGDLLEAALALASIFALRSNWRFAIPLVWVTNIWGFVDLLNGVRGVLQLNVPSFNLATLWYVYTFYAPLVIVSHVMIFGILLKSRSWKK
jgi:hypothetical protein